MSGALIKPLSLVSPQARQRLTVDPQSVDSGPAPPLGLGGLGAHCCGQGWEENHRVPS